MAEMAGPTNSIRIFCSVRHMKGSQTSISPFLPLHRTLDPLLLLLCRPFNIPSLYHCSVFHGVLQLPSMSYALSSPLLNPMDITLQLELENLSLTFTNAEDYAKVKRRATD